jgi:hypothetical protein
LLPGRAERHGFEYYEPLGGTRVQTGHMGNRVNREHG